jgi:phosphatidylserine/phosphatidylglycerophosphate/cardiolipin synthase-like enzyme
LILVAAESDRIQWRPVDTGRSRRRLTGALLLVVIHLAGPAEPAPEVYFSPRGGIQPRLLRAINHTKATIDLAVFDLTAGELAGALLTARARGVMVRIVADARQAQGRHSEIPVLLGQGVTIRLLPDPRRGHMHHKFAIFDGKLVVTGSYNWTESAAHQFRERRGS